MDDASRWRRGERWAQAVALAALVVLAWALAHPLRHWFIEDAAISFAYARNLAHGDGLVAFPGHERVEGYSNPLWVFLIAAFEAVGIESFPAAKGLGLALSSATIPLVYALTGRLASRPVPLVAAVLVAIDTPLRIWSTSGLENSLFAFLLALGAWRLLVERERGGLPISAVAFLGVTLTRPEGLLYAAVAGAWVLASELAARRLPRRSALWAVTFAVPFAAYHVARFQYFAFPLPMTYYAKMSDLPFDLLAWETRSWRYLRTYGDELGQAWWIPVYALGLLGLRGWRGGVALALSLAVGAALLLPGLELVRSLPIDVDRPHRAWAAVQVGALLAVLVIPPIAGLGRERGLDRVLLWGLGAVGLVFAVRSGGDWMRGFRWLSLVSVPSAVILAAGLGEVADGVATLRGRTRWGLAGSAIVGLVVATSTAFHISWLGTYYAKPVATPNAVFHRVKYYQWVARRLELDRRLLVLDHDMGAPMYWGHAGARFIDARGLVDVPFALHHWRPDFVLEYVFDEQEVDFIHAHASTGRAVRNLPRFRTDYIELPLTGHSHSHHGGTFALRSLLLMEDAGLPERPVDFASGVQLVGFDVPSPEVGPDSGVFVEIALKAPKRASPFRVVAFLADEERVWASWEAAPAYDFIEPKKWAGDEVLGRFGWPLPEELPLGRYALGFAVLDADGLVPAVSAPADAVLGLEGDARFAVGEVRFPDVVHIVSREDMVLQAAEDLNRTRAAADANRCREAEEHWERALRHRSRSGRWRSEHRPSISEALASCWVRHADAGGAMASQVWDLERARRWNLKTEGRLEVQARVGAEAYGRGLEAREAGDVDEAYRFFSWAVRADPTLAWARRYAEEARAERLGLPPVGGLGRSERELGHVPRHRRPAPK